MLTGNTRRASPLTLALAGLLITATVSAADVQSQARGVLIGQRPIHAAVSEATSPIGGSTSRPKIDAQQQAAGSFPEWHKTSRSGTQARKNAHHMECLPPRAPPQKDRAPPADPQDDIEKRNSKLLLA